MNKEVFSAFVTNLRKEAGMTQKQVANKLQVTDRAVSKWERGLSYPDITLMEPLSVVLGISVEELLTCQRKETPAPEPELPALRSVLTITQEEKRIRTRRTRALVWAAIAAALVLLNSPYLGWNYSDPETAVAGAAFHAFEWLFVRLAPLVIIGAVIGLVLTRNKA